MVASMLVPFQVLMIPLVSIYGKFNLLNNKYVLVYMYIGFGASLAVFIYHAFSNPSRYRSKKPPSSMVPPDCRPFFTSSCP